MYIILFIANLHFIFIFLPANEIGSVSMPYLAASIQNLRKLTHFKMAENNIMDTGAFHLVSLLPPNLKHLDISSKIPKSHKLPDLIEQKMT